MKFARIPIANASVRPTAVMRCRRAYRAGITLIELLVVIAIIAILAAILLPALASAKMEPQRAACINALKQITLSSMMYVDDMKVWVGPMSADPTQSQGDWMGAMLYYYGKSTNSLFCPVAPDHGNPDNAVNPPGKADSAWHWTLVQPGLRGELRLQQMAFGHWLAWPIQAR